MIEYEKNLWTNIPEIYREVCEKEHDLLIWFMYHNRPIEVGQNDLDFLKRNPNWNRAKKIFLVDNEGVVGVREKNCWINLLNDDPRVYLWESAILEHPRYRSYLFWFEWARVVEKHVHLRYKLIGAGEKHPLQKFDALLGTMYDRRHKLLVLDKIETSPNKNLFLLGSKKPIIGKVPDDWIPGGEFDTLTTQLPYGNKNDTANNSVFIPYEIYNKTWYTIACETRGEGPPFFTEKTAKPLIAGRIFVLFGPKNHLASLHRFGYKTFDNIIDESYDNIEDDRQRWEAAWRSVEQLIDLDPVWAYQQCQDRLEHNQRLIIDTDWEKQMINEMRLALTST